VPRPLSTPAVSRPPHYFTSWISNGIPPNWLLAVSVLPLMLPVDNRGVDLPEWNVMPAPAASYVP
jgi:hypothetical protein